MRPLSALLSALNSEQAERVTSTDRRSLAQPNASLSLQNSTAALCLALMGAQRCSSRCKHHTVLCCYARARSAGVAAVLYWGSPIVFFNMRRELCAEGGVSEHPFAQAQCMHPFGGLIDLSGVAQKARRIAWLACQRSPLSQERVRMQRCGVQLHE